MLQKHVQMVKELESKLNELKPHLNKAEEIERQIRMLYSACEHPFEYISGHDTDDFEGRTYDQIRCPDCSDFKEYRSGRYEGTYFNSYPLKNTEGNREKLKQRMEYMKSKNRNNAYQVLLEKYKQFVSEMQ